jgi:hypothetical protein
MKSLYSDDSNSGDSVWWLTTDWTTGISSSAEKKYFSSSLCVQTSSEAHPASYPMGTRGKALRDTYHSPLSSADVKNELEPSSPSLRLHGEYGRASFYFYSHDNIYFIL